ncbi:hypothetical protein L8106_29120 [Lyngbya sp. PCC 8106]|nr:hypothetical protein L8106_29120 [Lyngbya sp. PCC 8106]
MVVEVAVAVAKISLGKNLMIRQAKRQ